MFLLVRTRENQCQELIKQMQVLPQDKLLSTEFSIREEDEREDIHYIRNPSQLIQKSKASLGMLQVFNIFWSQFRRAYIPS